VLTALGLPTTYRADAFAQLLESMRVDKKARGNRLRFVVLDGLARPVTIDDPDPAVLVAAYSEVAAS
jgi:3-dehydroquinate synthase